MIVDYAAPQDFSGDMDSKLEQWIAAALAGNAARLPTGIYATTRQLNIETSFEPTKGAKIFGDGCARSIIDTRLCPVGVVPVYIHCDSTWSGDGKGDNYFLSMKDLGFWGDTAGPLLQVGRDDFRDPVNCPDFDIHCLNFSKSGSAVAVRLNYVVGGKMRLIANTGGPGIALQCRQAGFNVFEGSFGALQGVGIAMQDGFNTGNLFNAPDIENVFCCLRIFNQQTVGNTFIAGTWSYSSSGVFATDGSANMLINPQANPVAPATLTAFRGYMQGVTVLGGNA